MERDLEYENNNIGYDAHCGEIDGIGIKCKNYELCKSVLPKWWYDCKGNYLCIECHMMFGTWGEHTGKGILTISNDLKCHICLEVKRSISQPRCDHTLCIECFKRCYYGDDSGEPQFPYPEIEDKYYDEEENPIWDIQYPLIKKYNEEWEKWDNDKTNKYENEKHLRMCPLCRS